MNDIQFYFITYSDYQDHINNLVTKINNFLLEHDNIQITKIFAVLRGGLPIGTHLSNYLNIDLITSHEDYLKEDPKNILVVDDLCDSGKTFEKYKKSILACLFIKPRRIITPDIYIRELANNIWVVFPWEQFEKPKINKDYMFEEKII